MIQPKRKRKATKRAAAATVANPTGAPRPVKIITDRAKRYRAVAAAQEIDWGKGRPRCQYCGRPGRMEKKDRVPQLMIDHVDGNEANENPRNLARACRWCNTRKGAHFARTGRGKRTAQYNPNPAGRGARTLGAYLSAIMVLKGQGEGDFQAARELIHNTPHAKRSEFASEIWGKRYARAKGQEVPF